MHRFLSNMVTQTHCLYCMRTYHAYNSAWSPPKAHSEPGKTLTFIPKNIWYIQIQVINIKLGDSEYIED